MYIYKYVLLRQYKLNPGYTIAGASLHLQHFNNLITFHALCTTFPFSHIIAIMHYNLCVQYEQLLRNQRPSLFRVNLTFFTHQVIMVSLIALASVRVTTGVTTM